MYPPAGSQLTPNRVQSSTSAHAPSGVHSHNRHSGDHQSNKTSRPQQPHNPMGLGLVWINSYHQSHHIQWLALKQKGHVRPNYD